VLTLAISHHSSLLVRVDEDSDGIMKDVLRIQEVLGICYPQSAVPVKIEPEDWLLCYDSLM
jgi:hypothetical protein